MNNVWLHLNNKKTLDCVNAYLERARAFFRQPGVMGHIKWPCAATLISEDKAVETMCHRNGMVFADGPDWPVRHDRKGHAALVLWTDQELPKGLTHIIETRYDNTGYLLRKSLYKVNSLNCTHSGDGEQTLLLEVDEIHYKEYT